MSFFNTKKNKSRTIGIAVAVFITGFMTLGFLQSYQQTKLRQVKKIDLVQVAIFADKKPVAEPILYEVVPTEECIKQRTFYTSQNNLALASVTSSMSLQASSAALRVIADESTASAVSASSLANAHAAASVINPVSSARATKVLAASPGLQKKPAAPEPILVPAKTPKCIAKSFTPPGHEKLGSEGFVGLALNLAKTGRIERGEIEVSSGFPELDTAALKQVTEGWQFEPCKKQNKIVACKQHIRFRWQVI
ncbi:MAG: TonB family protein [Pseudomonadota bacterium]